MASEATIDLIPLERLLQELSASIRKADEEESWIKVESASRELANHLRVRNAPVDNHTILGKTELPQTLTSLLSLSLHGSHLPGDARTAPILEILRVGANLCMDHDENRAALLEVGFPQSVMSLLEGYAETIPSPQSSIPLPLSIPHLKIVRTSIGVLLNASIGFDPVKFRLISLEAALTIIKLSSTIYPPTAWTSYQSNFLEAEGIEEWNLRSGISNWAWRTVSALKDVQDESLQVTNSDILPWITSPLLKFCPPHPAESSSLEHADPDLLDTLVQTDFDFLEESCTIIESLSLDVEDFRLELARSTCYPEPSTPTPCLTTILNFIEYGSYPPVWKNPIFDEAEIKNKEKAFDICKAALIKAIVEVFAEEKNEEILWNNDDPEHPGGLFIIRFVQWIKGYVDTLQEESQRGTGNARDDMAICASLALGNLVRKAPLATTLISTPYSLAPVLSSPHFFSPSTDIKLKHGILGLLKHLSQFSKISPIIPTTLAEVGIIERIAASGIWDEKTDAMADVIQLNAIGVAKHMCNASLDHTIALVLPSGAERPSGLFQILALIKRSDSVSIKSEGSRVLVNVVKSLWVNERTVDASDERQKKRDLCISIVVTPEYVTALASLIGRSNRYPILVNEGIVALSLLSTHKSGGPLVVDALTVPLNGTTPAPVEETLSLANGGGSPSLPTPSSRNDGLPVPRHALDMLVYVLRNVDNPVNFPMEVRLNTCTFFLQLQRHASVISLTRVREAVLPVVQQVAEDSREIEEEEKLAKAANLLLESWTRKQPSA
ncbi:hypothetical protein GALMADRAFT_239590 [Galerina marginata CBS 339.88]|uniref:Uncharacterized protein n=1 Tax=Galerina marginata (strain CBS 339.88) TaxID=685588 RepID=A0A067TEJ9_GALM3|nr:hypothetical protein GALMADRAFT_239590 [Galerina marginata CBS 339.88]